jgi:membrane-bound ClpP family serine protease
MTPLVWIVLLIGVGLALILLEVFVPSGGALGLLSVLALAAGVVAAFLEQGALVGLGVLAGTVVAVPAVLVVAFRWFPATPLGRRVLPPAPEPEEVLPDIAERLRLRALIGRQGQTTSDLLPWGTAEFDGDSFDAVSEGGPLGPGTAVEAIAVQGRAVMVRPVPNAAAAGDRPAAEPTAAAHTGPSQEPALPGLSSLLEDFDFEELRQNKPAAGSLDAPPPANQA